MVTRRLYFFANNHNIDQIESRRHLGDVLVLVVAGEGVSDLLRGRLLLLGLDGRSNAVCKRLCEAWKKRKGGRKEWRRSGRREGRCGEEEGGRGVERE